MDKPMPEPTAESRPFWEAAADGRLIYQRCAACGRAQFYPRSLCSHCGSKDLEWRPSSGQGVVHAATRVHIGLPAFKDEAPYDVVLVDVDEGFRMLMNVVGNPADLAIGDRGRIIFELRGDVWLPQFERAAVKPSAD